MVNFMNSVLIKFVGSENEEAVKYFTVGKHYHADCSSAGNFMVVDDNGDDWLIELDDDDFELSSPAPPAIQETL